MRALATRPKPWRVVNGQPNTDDPPEEAPPEPDLAVAGGPLDLTEKIYGGDALARFAAARFDPDALAPETTADDEAIFELGVISTGGDPEMEALRDAMAAANPDGKPVRTIRYGRTGPPDPS